MEIRLGYIGNNKEVNNFSTDKTVSVLALNKLESNEKKISKLKKVAKSNILNTLKVLEYNKSLGIKIYGLSPKLFPLPNYPEVEYFRYIDLLKSELLKLGEYIKANDFRANIHVEGTIMLNAMSEKLYQDAVKNIQYQNVVLNAMGLDEKAKIIVNLGGAYNNREDAIGRFKVTFKELDEALKKRIVLNNVDNTIDVNTTLNICNEFSIPYYLNPNINNVNERIIDRYIKSWEGTDLPALLGLRNEDNLVKLEGLDKSIDVLIPGYNRWNVL
jgi:UV DNA damage endonuclease